MVPVGMDEIRFADQVRAIVKTLKTKRTFVKNFTILTATSCNARCFYCYQADCEHINMSEQTARDTAAFIARASGEEEVSLHWFGGEPLCNVKAIDTICSELRDRGVAYRSKMVTNGYLFTPEIIERASLLWKLEIVQITLDGTKEVYQRIKAYANGDEKAFERVLDNIACLTEKGIKVFIRLNTDRDNAEDMFTLCDILFDRFRSAENLIVYPVLLKKFVGSISEFESEQEAIDTFIRLDEKLEAYGMAKPKRLSRDISINRCMGDDDAFAGIMPDGSLIKCEHFDTEERLGTIYSDEKDQGLISAWKERIICEECKTCPHYPRCIELKKCPWAKDGCSGTVRALKTYKLKKSILKAYEKTNVS